MSIKNKGIRIKEWCKKHQDEIIIAATGAIGVGIVCYGGKKAIDGVKALTENLNRQRDVSIAELEDGMFANGVRKYLLKCDYDDYVSNVSDSVKPLVDICGGENNVCGLRNGNHVLVMSCNIAADRGSEVVETVKESFSGLDNLEIWVGGTIKE